jgi:hypothetical protein
MEEERKSIVSEAKIYLIKNYLSKKEADQF